MDRNVVLPQELLSEITDLLLLQGRVQIEDLGVLEVKVRQPRRCRNPRTGDRMIAPRRLAVSFRAGAALRRRLADELARMEASLAEGSASRAATAAPRRSWWRLW